MYVLFSMVKYLSHVIFIGFLGQTMYAAVHSVLWYLSSRNGFIGALEDTTSHRRDNFMSLLSPKLFRDQMINNFTDNEF